MRCQLIDTALQLVEVDEVVVEVNITAVDWLAILATTELQQNCERVTMS